MKPLARKNDLYAENLPGEVVLYDKTNNKVHCLNKTAAAIWESCDGTRTVDDLAQLVEAKLGAPTNREVVLLALQELEKAGLMEVGASVIPDAGFTSRREAVGKIALAGTALVATIIAPAPAAHASSSVPPPDPPQLPIIHNPPDPPPPPPKTGNNPPGAGKGPKKKL
ncbi:MAG TPA: PqqD family protein [Terriglobia bacterium]|nr:PqqD family protein [Terriglobia bacterium]